MNINLEGIWLVFERRGNLIWPFPLMVGDSPWTMVTPSIYIKKIDRLLIVDVRHSGWH
jgi:hypothetical protein